MSITNTFAEYIVEHDIIKDCGFTRVAQIIELSDWINGDALRFLPTRGDVYEALYHIF